MTATMHSSPTSLAPAAADNAGRQTGAVRRGRDVVARSWPSLAAGAAALGLILYMAFDSGAYFPDAYLRAAWIAFVGLGLLLVLRPPHYLLGTHALLAAAALAGLVAWTALSSNWSVAPSSAL